MASLLLSHGAELESGAKIGGGDTARMTSLHYAAEGGRVEMVRLLLRCGADLEAKGNSGWTPLTYAVGSGHPAVAELLLERGASVACPGYSGSTIFVDAMRCWSEGRGEGWARVISMLLVRGLEVDGQIIRTAAGKTEALRCLLDHVGESVASLVNEVRIAGGGAHGRTQHLEAHRSYPPKLWYRTLQCRMPNARCIDALTQRVRVCCLPVGRVLRPEMRYGCNYNQN